MTAYYHLLIINIGNGQQVYDLLKVLQTAVNEPETEAISAPVSGRQLWSGALWNTLVRETVAH